MLSSLLTWIPAFRSDPTAILPSIWIVQSPSLCSNYSCLLCFRPSAISVLCFWLTLFTSRLFFSLVWLLSSLSFCSLSLLFSLLQHSFLSLASFHLVARAVVSFLFPFSVSGLQREGWRIIWPKRSPPLPCVVIFSLYWSCSKRQHAMPFWASKGFGLGFTCWVWFVWAWVLGIDFSLGLFLIGLRYLGLNEDWAYVKKKL